MQNPRLATRYAKSLIDLAVEQNAMQQTLSDVQLLDTTIRASRELATVLRSPVIKADKKDAVITAIFGSQLSKLTLAFVRLLTSKGREATLPEITSAFMNQYRVMHHISEIRLITAAPVSEAVKESIRQKVAAALPGQTIELTTKVQPELIGGFILEMGDKLVDASIKRDLADIRKQFTQNLYVPNIK